MIAAARRGAPPKPRILYELGAALAYSGDGGFVTGTDGRILLWNHAAERLLGYAGADVVGKPGCDVLRGLDGAGHRVCFCACHRPAQIGTGREAPSYDVRAETKAGAPLWINVSVRPLELEDSGPVLLHLFHDVTPTKTFLSSVDARIASAPASSGDSAARLTARELEVLRMLADGLGTRAVAERLHVSRATVRNHVQNIFAKLGVHSRVAALAAATKQHLV